MKRKIVITDVALEKTFENGFVLSWDSNLGFGEMTFIKQKDKNSNEFKLCVETECMSDNEDKEFIKLVLNKFIDKLEVIE